MVGADVVEEAGSRLVNQDGPNVSRRTLGPNQKPELRVQTPNT